MALLDIKYFSPALGKNVEALAIVPETAGPYHVLFLLHGLSDDHTIWQRRTSVERYVEGLPLIVVMPNGDRSFYCDAEDGLAYGTAIGEELPALIRRWFPTVDGWAIGGLSMGGYGSVRLGLTYPETFKSVVSHSGALYYGRRFPEWRDNPAFIRETERIIGKDPTDGPNDLYSLALKASPRPAIRIDCGTDDFLIEDNRRYHEFLASNGIDHEYEEFPGDHNWAYWDEHVQEAIAFHVRTLGISR